MYYITTFISSTLKLRNKTKLFEMVQQLTEVAFHALRLVLLELCDGTAKQRDNDTLQTTQCHSYNDTLQTTQCHSYNDTLQTTQCHSYNDTLQTTQRHSCNDTLQTTHSVTVVTRCWALYECTFNRLKYVFALCDPVSLFDLLT